VPERKYRIIVGLEIHVQLCTQSKMFCPCALEFAAQPNSLVCPVCLGMPGSLPVMNRKAVEYAVLAATALNCTIARFTKWDRKSYYYPDLPKNYQISQYDLPLGSDGFIEIPVEGAKTKKVGIIRVHLEEDAGKNLHAGGDYSRVDLNRAGTPLLEIVTAPQMNSGAEVRALAEQLQRIVRYLGVSQADMQKGHMRFEPNVNVVITDHEKEYRTPITEIKNLNSFRSLEKSVEYEAARQLEEFRATGRVIGGGTKTTRGWNDAREITVLQREKEEAHDYRYFPDPDLVPVTIDEAWVGRAREGMCELPLARQRRYVSRYGLSVYDAGVLTADRATADFFEQVIDCGAEAKRACNLITQHYQRIANQRCCGAADLGVTPAHVAELAGMVDSGLVSASAAAEISDITVEETDISPRRIAERENLIQKSNAAELAVVVERILAANPGAVDDVKSAGKKSKAARGFLVGQVMKATEGRANPKVVSRILERMLS